MQATTGTGAMIENAILQHAHDRAVKAFCDMLQADIAEAEESRRFWNRMLDRKPSPRVPLTPGSLKPCAHAVRSIFKGESDENH